MTGQEAIAYIHSRFGVGKKRGMHNLEILLGMLGNPQERFHALHVAGTNGKGSVCTYLQSALSAQGYRTGAYTSPYLQSYHERICVDAVPVSDDDLGAAVAQVRAAVEQMEARGLGAPTEFEVGTATAFVHFARAGVDYAVVEVGIGGRHDVTNIIKPKVGVIVSIGLDHVKILGDTVEQIAYEKAGIAKPGVPLVVYPQCGSVMAVIDYCAQAAGTTVTRVLPGAVHVLRQDRFGATFCVDGFEPEISIFLPGDHQVYNAATALAALLALRDQGAALSDDAIVRGFEAARWHGRLEWVRPDVLIDGAHNCQGAAALADYLQTYLPDEDIALVCGVLRDKDYPQIARQLARFARSACVIAPDSHRALGADDFAAELARCGVAVRTFDGFDQAFAAASGTVTVVAGSLYLAGEARTALMARSQPG